MPSAAFEPLFPREGSLGPLRERAAALIVQAHRIEALAAGLTGPLAPLLRAMNSYYSNRIEGQHTRPADIQRALARKFDADAGQARKQRLAVAHIEAEGALEAQLPSERGALYEPAFLQRIHQELFRRLPAADLVTVDGLIVTPGAFRSSHVTAGHHVAPDPSDVPALLDAWSARYGAVRGLEDAVIAALCSHHRLLWVHPFFDGNGRAARLHTHLVLTALRLTHGIWSPLRGMARDQEGYYARLNNADLPRRNDLDGRGALSEEELVRFVAWLLDVCLDQSSFMADLLDVEGLRGRLRDLLGWLGAHPWTVGGEKSVVKTDALEALHYVTLTGPVERGRFMAMTGLPPRSARRVLASLVDFGVLVTESPRAPVGFGIPHASLRFVFPRLWPEAEADADAERHDELHVRPRR